MAIEPTRVLHVIGAMDRGGAETLIMNLYRAIDTTKYQFDFLVNDTDCDYDEEIEALGGRIYQIPRYNIFNYWTYRKACQDFFKTHKYKLVHGHIALPATVYLHYAQKSGAITIAHSHAQNYPLSPAEAAFRLCTRNIKKYSNFFLACSEQAGLDRFGKDVVSSNRFHVLQNGIDVSKFTFSAKTRSETRYVLGLKPDEPVFIHVGRLTPIKNHDFLFRTFACILKRMPTAKLLLVGKGELQEDLAHLASKLNIANSISFLGIRKDVADLLCAADVFIFPSKKEGLANAVVEAQTNGLRCLISTGVPKLAAITDASRFLPLSLGPQIWANEALDLLCKPIADRASCSKDTIRAHFSINESAAWLEQFYNKAMGNED